MSQDAFLGIGTTFTWGSNQIAEINAINGIAKSRGTQEVTDLSSPNKYREWIPGLKDGGEVTLSMNMVRDAVDEFDVDFDAGTTRACVVTFPDEGATTISFDAFITSLSWSVPLENKVPCEVKLKITGPVVLES